MSSPRVLCIAGSPRRGGNSDRLAEALLGGVNKAGGSGELLIASAAGAKPCRGCNACSKDGRCIQRDGMDAVYAAIDAADAIAICTPVFFATVPAVLKVLYDRFQPYWARRYVLGEPARDPKRPGALLIVGGGGDPFGTGCAITPSKSAMNVIGVSSEVVFECVGPDRPGDIMDRPDCLKRAEEIGRELVSAVPLGG